MSTRRPAAPRGAAGARGANRGRGAAERPAPPRAKAAPRPTASAGATAARPAGRQAPRRGVTLGAPRADGRPRPTISLRALGLLIVALVAFTVLAPTLRYAVAQQEQLRTLNAQVSDARERTAALEHELERWQDPAYVQAQARDRLGYVMPGETPYVVVDPETVTGGESPAEAEAAERAAARAAATPWYVRVWDSVQVAGESATGEEDPSGLTTPTEDALTPTGAPTGPPPGDAVTSGSAVSEQDLAVLTEQLGREPRGVVAVAARCRCGRPTVVRTAPRLPDGTPFPTSYYLTHPAAVRAVSTLEAGGVMAEMNERLAADAGLRAAYAAAHEDYLARRAELGHVPEIDGVSAGGMPTRVKCLHALLAHTLAVGPGVNPFGDETLALLAGRWSPDRCAC